MAQGSTAQSSGPSPPAAPTLPLTGTQTTQVVSANIREKNEKCQHSPPSTSLHPLGLGIDLNFEIWAKTAETKQVIHTQSSATGSPQLSTRAHCPWEGQGPGSQAFIHLSTRMCWLPTSPAWLCTPAWFCSSALHYSHLPTRHKS